MGENNSKENRLPPPAFPPGQRRHLHASGPGQRDGVRSPSEDGALIGPDDPIPLRRDPIEQAFISPDEPIPERRLELTQEFADFAPPTPDDGEGEAVGMDLDAHDHQVEVVAGGDPHVMELVDAVSRLAADLRRKGEAGLRAAPGTTRFDATLRAYCVGYLAGRRAEAPPPPVIEDEY